MGAIQLVEQVEIAFDTLNAAITQALQEWSVPFERQEIARGLWSFTLTDPGGLGKGLGEIRTRILHEDSRESLTEINVSGPGWLPTRDLLPEEEAEIQSSSNQLQKWDEIQVQVRSDAEALCRRREEYQAEKISNLFGELRINPRNWPIWQSTPEQQANIALTVYAGVVNAAKEPEKRKQGEEPELTIAPDSSKTNETRSCRKVPNTRDEKRKAVEDWIALDRDHRPPLTDWLVETFGKNTNDLPLVDEDTFQGWRRYLPGRRK